VLSQNRLWLPAFVPGEELTGAGLERLMEWGLLSRCPPPTGRGPEDYGLLFLRAEVEGLHHDTFWWRVLVDIDPLGR
jgi:hypothetical protein